MLEMGQKYRYRRQYLRYQHVPDYRYYRYRIISAFLPRDATQSAVTRLHVVCPSRRRPSVAFRYGDHIGWNTSKFSKIISLPNSLRLMRLLTTTWAIWCNGNTPKLGLEWGWGQEHIKAAKSPKRCKIGPWRINRKSHTVKCLSVWSHSLQVRVNSNSQRVRGDLIWLAFKWGFTFWIEDCMHCRL